MISVRVQGDELLALLEDLPKRLQAALKEKLGEEIMPELRQKLFEGRPGKFFDQEFIRAGADQIGSQVIGYIEAEEKDGLYPITPSKAKVLRFIGNKDGAVVYTKLVLHQYFSKEVVGRYISLLLEDNRERIQAELDAAVSQVVRRRR